MATTTAWIGAEDGDLLNEDNWSHGVPSSTVGAVFGEAVENFSTTTVSGGAGDFEAMSLLFTDELAENITVSTLPGASWLRLHHGDTITVQAGAPAVHIQTSGSRGIRLTRGETSYIRNYSDNLLRITMSRGVGSGHADVRFDGPGDVEFYNAVMDSTGFVTLVDSFTGSLIIPTGAALRNWNDTNINGGTLILDGYTDAKEYGDDQLFNVNDGGRSTPYTRW